MSTAKKTDIADNNVKMDNEHHTTLKIICALRGISMREQIEALIDEEAKHLQLDQHQQIPFRKSA